MRTLLTGFGPFLDVSDNPSARLARHFSVHGAPGHRLTVRVLPVSFGWTGIILPHLIKAGRYDAALLLGVDSGGGDRIRLERFGRNVTRGNSPDVDGFAPGEAPITPGAPDLFATRVDVGGLLGKLEAEGIVSYLSEDAGGYVCNHVYYTALRAIAEADLPTRCLFLHVPPATPACPLERQQHAVEIALAWLADGAMARGTG
jgi:pyroglutamyl-peptidase